MVPMSIGKCCGFYRKSNYNFAESVPCNLDDRMRTDTGLMRVFGRVISLMCLQVDSQRG